MAPSWSRWIVSHASKGRTLVFQNRYSSTVTQIRSNKLTDNLNIDNANDIPVLVLPHSVKKAFKVHAALRTQQPLEKASWLTKTLLETDLPEELKQETPNIPEEYDKSLQEILWHHAGAQKQKKVGAHNRLANKDISLGLLLDMLRVVMAETNGSEHLQRSFLDHLPNVQTHWFRNFLFFQTDVQNRPDYVLRTVHPVAPVQDVEGCVVRDPSGLPGPFNPYSLSTFITPVVKLRNSPGYYNGEHNPIRYPHTILMSFKGAASTEHLQSKALMSAFLQLHAHALSMRRLPGTVLAEPMVTHCIVTNGAEMIFCVYQLNTLSMLDDFGVWNKAWISPPLALFQSHEEPGRGFHESAGTDGLVDYNEDCLRHFMLLLHRPTVPN